MRTWNSIFYITFLILSSRTIAQEVTVQKFENITDNVFMDLNQCTSISTDLWTGQHNVIEAERTSVYCALSEDILKCSFMDTSQKIFNTELFNGVVSGKRMVIMNDFTTFIADLDSKYAHSETTTSLNQGRIQINKVCTGVWDYEKNLRKQAEEEEENKKT